MNLPDALRIRSSRDEGKLCSATDTTSTTFAWRSYVAGSTSLRFAATLLRALTACLGGLALVAAPARAQAPIHVGFLWHMHQPIYYPGENITQTDAAGRFSFSVTDVHNQRLGPYTTWPRNAIQSGLSLPHLGAQVSFSGSLIANLNQLEATGVNGGQWNNWEGAYKQAAQWDTSLGNPRLDLVGFGYYHPLMPLLDERDMRMQIRLHKHVHEQTWGPNVPYSKGFFPAETAFSTKMIPALVAEGIEWTIFDSIHLERATIGYPHTNSSNLYPPNPADQINPALPANQWVQLNNLWAPSKVAAPLAYRPHNVQHVDPNTGQIQTIVGVPAARYEGNEDGRGGFGALQYEQVMEQYRQLNTDPARPMFVLLHHDGDNFGGGSESYYHGNFQNMVSWAAGNPNYDVSTVQDYLDRYPVPAGDVVHVEPGSWAGADNGDPEFKKWLGDPGPNGWSPDRNSWAVLTAAKNRVYTAHDIMYGGPDAFPNMQNVMISSGNAVERGWSYLLQAQASDYWYWDGTEIWDSDVTRGSNLAVQQVDPYLAPRLAQDATPPSVFQPQREHYNPGGFEWSPNRLPSDFEVWTYAYDVSGLQSVTLNYRIDLDGVNPLSSIQNETYAGGDEVGSWTSVTMSASDVAPPVGILAPTYRAMRYGAMVTGVENALVDYYVEAIDNLGNVARSEIQHVYVGTGASQPGGDTVTLSPDPAIAGQSATISYDPLGGPLASASTVKMHYGFNDWQTVHPTDVAMTWDPDALRWTAPVPMISSANQFDVVFNNGSGVWDNNGGQDWHFAVQGAVQPGFTMDGVLDASAVAIAGNGGRQLYVALEGTTLYVATEAAGQGNDVFIFLAEQPGALQAAPWAKSGQVAGWSAFLADENDNDYEGWFDAPAGSQAATAANGGVLEGTIDLAAEFGSLPAQIYLAVAHYATANGGALVSALQIPASLDANGNLDASEFVAYALLAPEPEDFNRDGIVDAADLATWQASYGPSAGADANGDDRSDGADFLAWQRKFGASAAKAASTAIPEPAAFMLAGLAAAIGAVARRRKTATMLIP
ncbi:MAG: PEP-CTERM sorting domain-containing protein [Pirellulales bacterium]|nr:PEP-CTERM sorting domain-containing protein [Pirellulales bacterium]